MFTGSSRPPVTDWNSAFEVDTGSFGRFFRNMLEGGIYCPSQIRSGLLERAHTEHDVQKTIAGEHAFEMVAAENSTDETQSRGKRWARNLSVPRAQTGQACLRSTDRPLTPGGERLHPHHRGNRADCIRPPVALDKAIGGDHGLRAVFRAHCDVTPVVHQDHVASAHLACAGSHDFSAGRIFQSQLVTFTSPAP